MTERHERSQFKPKYTTITNKQREYISEDAELQQQLSSEPQELRAPIWTKRKTFYTTLLLLVIVGGVMTVVIPRYMQYNKNSDNQDLVEIWTEDEYSDSDDRLPQLRSASINKRSKSPKDLGRMNIYIRKPNPDGVRQQSKQFRFPVARYNRQDFPMNGPFISLTPWIPIFVDRRTRQTIIYSPTGGVYIIPPVINLYGNLYSIGELIKSGYATLVSGGGPLTGPINMLSYFQPTPLYGHGIPRISPRTGSFIGGIQTNYERFNIPSTDDYPSYEPEEQEAEEDDDDSYKPRRYSEKNYKKSYSRPTRFSTHPPVYKNKSSYNGDAYSQFNFCGRHYADKLKRQYLSSKVPNFTRVIDNDNENDTVDLNDTSKLDNCGCQKPILTPNDLHEHGLLIILHLTKEDDSSVRNACKKLPKLKRALLELHPDYTIDTMLGFGYDKTQEWFTRANIPFPKNFIPFQEKRGPTGMFMPSTGGDIYLDIRSTRKDLCFELGRQFYNLISSKCIAKLDDTFVFGYMSSNQTGLGKDFIGFEDGNDNPAGYTARAATALIQDDVDVHIGGSFAFTQKWVHDLTKFNMLTEQQQVDVVGRTKGDGSIEIEPKLPTSHIGHVHLEKDGVDVEILRKSLPYGLLEYHGLFFVAFAATIEQHEMQLKSMVGNFTGIHDHLMNFTKPVTGSYWYMPSIRAIQKLFYSQTLDDFPSDDPGYGSIEY